jgi:hypothetical protein
MSIPVVEYTIILDYTDKTNPNVPAIEILKSDTGTRKFSITLKSNGVALDITDLTVRIYFKKADGNITQGDPTIVDAATGQISYTLQSNDVAKVGQVICQITLSDASGNRITTFYFDFDVLDTAYSDDAVQSTTEFTLLTQYVDNFKHFGEYDSGTTYYINNVVEYNGSSYIALQTTNGNTPPIYPDLYNDYWYVIANGSPVTPTVLNLLKDTKTSWVVDSVSDPLFSIKKATASENLIGIVPGTMITAKDSSGGGPISTYPGIVVNTRTSGGYNYIDIYAMIDIADHLGALTLPNVSDTIETVEFTLPFQSVLGLSFYQRYADSDRWTMQWKATSSSGSITPTADFQPLDTFSGTLPPYGDYFVKIDIPVLIDGLSPYSLVFTISTLSGDLLDNSLSSKLGGILQDEPRNFQFQKTGLLSGTGTEKTIYILCASPTGSGTTTAELDVVSDYNAAIIQVWPACLPVMGGVPV